MAQLKKGDLIKFNFHGFGLVSQAETIVTRVTKRYIQVEEGEPEYRFDKITGECINDNTYMGCRRTLPKEYLQPPPQT